jgi:hypothetical protein
MANYKFGVQCLGGSGWYVMRPWIISILAVLITGCSHSPRVFHYPFLKVTVIKIDARHAPCGNSRWACCARIEGDGCTIYAGNSECWTHELRHCDRKLGGVEDDTHDGKHDWQE